ncbi:hydroxyethylthiazole kinase [Lactobacillus sp. DCY120]|uniref:Hydroxyethylthiazole kinase n=1 Tax=Bombilactobacillus apium TaxID=2675299 RepID=A0A850R902_9LACO|nr:hydroxyethylthiazole kinase [Bombilactobacillus apium]NVY97005.1 hydroxyethylthiazole kinase [Bombilactobacillus apium]
MITDFLETVLPQLQQKKPLVHHLTNYVTVNDCANITLAIGASPIMADEIQEVASITAQADALVLNLGTLNQRILASMLVAGQRANQFGIPIILDPVGVGISTFRQQAVQKLLAELDLAVIRGNRSEISFLAGKENSAKGVDSFDQTLDTSTMITRAQKVADKKHCVVAVTGATDIIVDEQQIVTAENGCPAMKQITGTGCMTTSLVGSFCGSQPQEIFASTLTALLAMGIAGEIGQKRTQKLGSGSLRTAIIDTINHLDTKTLQERGKFHEVTA